MFDKSQAGTQNVRSIIEGLHRFMKRTTGLTNDPIEDKYVVNPDYVLNNNLHFLQRTQQEGKPNADATTEGQSVLIIGYLYCYLGTGNDEYLEHAKKYWDAYVRWWYKGQPIPANPQRWICNWIINGKEPVLANYPLNPLQPTQGGFQGVEFNWVDGFLKIPHGAPNWGEYLDVATFAFDGALSYDSIKASVKGIFPDGSTNWDEEGVEYPVDWLILWTGDKVNWDGDVLSSGHTEEEKGSVQLKDTTLQGIHKFNYATRNPVEHGGYMIARNEPFHNRPIHTPLGDIINNMGNAADGEVWFLDACYLMWKATGEAKYKQALDCVHFTANEYTFIDLTNKFFRKDLLANTPFTEGISYEYTFPSTEVRYSRDGEGYINIAAPAPCDVSLEQQAVVFRINNGSKIRTTYGGVGEDGSPVKAEVKIFIADNKTSDGLAYVAALPPKVGTIIEEIATPITDFVLEYDQYGQKYLLASESATADYGDAIVTQRYTSGITGPTLVDGSRTANTIKAQFPTGDGGLIIGFWLTASETANVNSIVYKSTGITNLVIEDLDGWKWHYKLAGTGGEWVKREFDLGELFLNEYQSLYLDAEVFPTEPRLSELEQISITPDDSVLEPIEFEYYCVNEMPPAYDSDDMYVVRYTVTLNNQTAFVGKLGNCDVLDAREDSLKYSPGLIPFSNIYEPGSNEIGPWHGLPYPGYQAPSMYCLGLGENQEIRLKNSIDFMYDSQAWYEKRYGVLGPTASAYIWDRWDAVEFGPADTFTEYHWGDGKAWDGYQPRAFSWLCRTWQQLVDNGDDVPQKLIDYCNNWLTFLWEFTEREDNPGQWLPYTYPKETAPIPEEGNFNAGMGGLYLSGSCQAAMAGCELEFIDALIERIIVEFEDEYFTDKDKPDHIMNGSYTPWYGGYYFYGFHGAEAFKGLGAYLMYKTHKAGEPTNYEGVVEPYDPSKGTLASQLTGFEEGGWE